MSTVPQVPEVTPETPKQLRYEYQPTDEFGRPLGGRQVIIYTTPEELADKLAHQNTLLIRKLREEGRKRRLGIDDEVPATAEKATGIVQFKERELSAQERFDLAQKLNDPEHFTEARDLLFESAIGVSPAKLREVLNENQIRELQHRAADNYISFAQAKLSEGYFDCPENRELIADWVFKHNLAPTTANFCEAFTTLQTAGLLIGAPVSQQVIPPSPPVESEVETPTPASPSSDLAENPEANPQPPVVAPPRIGSEPQPPTTRQSHIPSGLNERVSSTIGSGPVKTTGATRQDGTVLTLKEINKMPPDELRRRLADPEFVKLVDRLENESRAKKAALGLSKF